ncbi:uncharacterized protein LOC135491750 [Lineus longissimus]|uniref:uncharacterized protein LOC135491750 n=1 Tax=Lineus longissimus TaxID=88925 RepID=UPI00315CF640
MDLGILSVRFEPLRPQARRGKQGRKDFGKYYCEGHYDKHGNWNTGFECKRWAPPEENVLYCCGDDSYRYCCPPEPNYVEPTISIPLVAGVTVAALIIIVLVALIMCCCCSSCVMYRKRDKKAKKEERVPTPTTSLLSSTTANGYTVTYTVCQPDMHGSPANLQRPLLADVHSEPFPGYSEGYEDLPPYPGNSGVQPTRRMNNGSQDDLCSEDCNNSDEEEEVGDYDNVWVPRNKPSKKCVRIVLPEQEYDEYGS